MIEFEQRMLACNPIHNSLGQPCVGPVFCMHLMSLPRGFLVDQGPDIYEMP